MGRLILVGGADPLTEGLGRLLASSGLRGAGDQVFTVDSGLDSPGPRASGSTVVYLAGARGGARGHPDLDDARSVFARCERSGVGHLIVVSSAAIFPPSHRHPGQVSESWPNPRCGAHPISRRWQRLERLARERFGTGDPASLTVIRTPTVPLSGGGNLLNRLFASRYALTLPGRNPTIQALDLEDLAEAIGLAGRSRPAGVFHVAPADGVPLRDALGLVGVRQVAIPGSWQRLVRALFAPSRSVSTVELDLIRHPWTISGRRVELELGFRPRYSSAEALRRFARQRRARGRPRQDPGEPAKEPLFDEFGLDRRYIAARGRTLFRFLHDVYWRIEIRGLEHVPREGPAVLAGVHRGFMPWDAVMTLHGVARETGRIPRFLVHPGLLRFPFFSDFIVKLGGLLACRENAAWVLQRGELLGIFPEGVRGGFAPYREAYRVGRFAGREFVRAALRHQAPIVPYVTVGSAEIFPILGKIESRWWTRVSEWPYIPLTPTFPLLPIPLPSKWHTRFLPPLEVHRDHPAEAAEDPETVASISAEVHRQLQETMSRMRARRPAIFWGSLFDEPG